MNDLKVFSVLWSHHADLLACFSVVASADTDGLDVVLFCLMEFLLWCYRVSSDDLVLFGSAHTHHLTAARNFSLACIGSLLCYYTEPQLVLGSLF